MTRVQGQRALTIPNAGTVSNVMDLRSLRATLAILSPADLTGAVTVEVSLLEAGPFVTLQSGGTDVAVAASKCVIIHSMLCGFVRLFSTAAEGAPRVFDLVSNWEQ